MFRKKTKKLVIMKFFKFLFFEGKKNQFILVTELSLELITKTNKFSFDQLS